MKNYSREFTDSEGKKVIHTWDNPYPPMYFHPEIKGENEECDEIKEEEDIDDKENKDNDKELSNYNFNRKYKSVKDVMDALDDLEKLRLKLLKKLKEIKEKEDPKKKKEEEKKRLMEIKDNLTCFMLKLNYIEDPEILLGYPIIQKNTGRGPKIKIELYPIPELLTYDGFIAQIGKRDEKLDFYFDISFKSANNEFYNYWVPIYVDKNHFEKNKEAILNSFSIIKFGAIGLKEYDFKTEYIFEVLPIILNKMIIGIFNNKASLSEAFIRCYFQYILLLEKLTKIYKKDFDKYIDNILKNIEKNKNEIDKRIIPDIGNFLVLLLFSNFEISDKLWRCLMEESSVRQMYWMFHSDETMNKVKEIMSESESIDKSRLFKSTENKIKDIAKATKKGDLKIVKINAFKDTLKLVNIYDQIKTMIIKDDNIFEFEEFKK